MLTIGNPLKQLNLPHKHAATVAKSLGILWTERRLDSASGMREVLAAIHSLNADPSVNGIVLHRPFPQPLSMHTLHQAVDMEKDVEGMHPSSLGKLVFRGSQGMSTSDGLRFDPCTAKAAIETLKLLRPELQGLEVLVVGESNVLAKPVCSYLHASGATVTACLESIPNLAAHTRAVDVVITSINKGPNKITGAMVKPGAVVLDLGINHVNNGIVGDTDVRSLVNVANVATLSSGIGIVRTAVLMNNIANT